MWEWIGTWTFFNWLAVIAFLMAIIGFLNAFLGLKSRWKDWRALKSKKSFQKRTEQIKSKLSRQILYNNRPITFFLDLIEDSAVILMFGILVFTSLIAIFATFKNRLDGLDAGAIVLLLGAMLSLYLFEIYKRVRELKTPLLAVFEFAELIKEGKKKNLITESEKEDLIALIVKHETFIKSLEKNSPFFFISSDEGQQDEKPQTDKIEKS